MARALPSLLVTLLITSNALAMGPQQRIIIDQIIGSAPTKPSFPAGESIYRTKGKSGLSCESCHSPDPQHNGEHQSTKKLIKPLDPKTNAARFTDAEKVAKWFRRNCNDVFGRPCEPQEKANFLTWLTQRESISAKP